eukprot:c25361_g1_i1.p1 GENE.c25361_g1_i1~~c25361_g1_i1.p1  ORF type:complete len:493 (+),score=111.52 c25361_g1_i1:50-1528(+)
MLRSFVPRLRGVGTAKTEVCSFATLASRNKDAIGDLVKKVLNPGGTHVVPPVPEFRSAQLLPAVATNSTTLENGLRVVTEPSSTNLATIGIYVDAGSRFEPANAVGATRVLRRLVLKGTNNRSQADLTREIEELGGQVVVQSCRERTVFQAQTSKQDLSRSVELLSDIFQNPKLDQQDIAQEIARVARESQSVDAKEFVLDKLHQMAFRGSSLGRSVLEPQIDAQTLTSDVLRDFARAHYTGGRVVIVGTGAVNHDELCSLVSKHFGKLPSQAPEGVKVSNGDKPFFVGSDVRMREDDEHDAHVAFAFEAPHALHVDSLVLRVVLSLLGTYRKGLLNVGDSAGKLARVVASEHLGQQVVPFYTPYADTGLFGVYYVGTPYQLTELAWQAQEEVTRLCYEVDEQDVRRAVNQVKASFAASGSNKDIGLQVLDWGRRMTLKESFDRLDAISGADVKRVANEYFYDKDLVVSALGPINKLVDYNRFRRRTYWLRY